MALGVMTKITYAILIVQMAILLINNVFTNVHQLQMDSHNISLLFLTLGLKSINAFHVLSALQMPIVTQLKTSVLLVISLVSYSKDIVLILAQKDFSYYLILTEHLIVILTVHQDYMEMLNLEVVNHAITHALIALIQLLNALSLAQKTISSITLIVFHNAHMVHIHLDTQVILILYILCLIYLFKNLNLLLKRSKLSHLLGR